MCYKVPQLFRIISYLIKQRHKINTYSEIEKSLKQQGNVFKTGVGF